MVVFDFLRLHCINWSCRAMLSLNQNGFNIISCFFHLAEWHPLE